MTDDSPDTEARRAQLEKDIRAAIDESNRRLSRPLDIESIKAELRAELDERGQPK
jgi:hypothetical protein